MKKIIIGVLVVLVVIGAGFGYMEYIEEKNLEDFAEQSQMNATEVVASTTEPRMITMAEIATHNTRTDCWMSINGVVLDVTTFVDKHPGGDRILEGCGKDATPYFKKVPGHSSGIVKMLLDKLKIGTVAQ